MKPILKEGTRIQRRLAKKFKVAINELIKPTHRGGFIAKRGKGFTKSIHNEAKAKMRRKMAKKSRQINRKY